MPDSSRSPSPPGEPTANGEPAADVTRPDSSVCVCGAPSPAPSIVAVYNSPTVAPLGTSTSSVIMAVFNSPGTALETTSTTSSLPFNESLGFGYAAETPDHPFNESLGFDDAAKTPDHVGRSAQGVSDSVGLSGMHLAEQGDGGGRVLGVVNDGHGRVVSVGGDGLRELVGELGGEVPGGAAFRTMLLLTAGFHVAVLVLGAINLIMAIYICKNVRKTITMIAQNIKDMQKTTTLPGQNVVPLSQDGSFASTQNADGSNIYDIVAGGEFEMVDLQAV